MSHCLPPGPLLSPFGLFLETYQQVDQATRSKMEEMLLTWQTTSQTTGKDLFGVIPQLTIECGIWI
jgi:pre-mRNA cleavage complex 2 protein Pcf11